MGLFTRKDTSLCPEHSDLGLALPIDIERSSMLAAINLVFVLMRRRKAACRQVQLFSWLIENRRLFALHQPDAADDKALISVVSKLVTYTHTLCPACGSSRREDGSSTQPGCPAGAITTVDKQPAELA
jgi:hypothetical protein